MITPELINLYEETIKNFNTKQKSIAEILLIDKTYQFIDIHDNNESKLFIQNIKNGIKIDFIEYVKSKCNC